ncbi:hypothetical protein MKX01_017442, partial [Papaver californicum]
MTMKNSFLSPNLVSNLQQVLNNRKGGNEDGEEAANEAAPTSTSETTTTNSEIDESKPIVLVTNGDGIDSWWTYFSCTGSMTVCETITVRSTEISGVSCTAYEVAGTPADCVSLALSGALFSWTKPAL